MKNRHLFLRLCLVALIVISTVIAAAQTLTHPAIPATPPNCNRYEAVLSSGGTGCTTGTGCPWWSPNVGITWNLIYWCCYDANGNLNNSTAPAPVCDWHLNGGCCNNLDTTPHCPSTGSVSCPLTGP